MRSNRLSSFFIGVALGLLPQVANCEEHRDLGKKKKKKKKRSKSMGKSPSAVVFDDLITFGDSTLDSGNLNSFKPDEFPVKFTTNFGMGTKVFPEYLGEIYGIDVTLSGHLVGQSPLGNNWAIGGARSTPFTFQDEFTPSDNKYLRVPVQVETYLNSVNGEANPDALYLISNGGNDVVDGLYKIYVEQNASIEDMMEHMEFAATSLAQSVKSLIDAGAHYVLVALIPDVGTTPFTNISPIPNPSNDASTLTMAFNSFLEEQIRNIECMTGIDIMVKPAPDIVEVGTENGLDTANPCWVASIGLWFALPAVFPSATPYTPACVSTNEAFKDFFFHDEIHVNTQVHELIAKDAFDFVEEATKQKKFPKLTKKKGKCGGEDKSKPSESESKSKPSKSKPKPSKSKSKPSKSKSKPSKSKSKSKSKASRSKYASMSKGGKK